MPFFMVAFLFFSSSLLAQNHSLAVADSWEAPSSALQKHYSALLQKYGRNYRYRAAEMTLNQFENTKEEYSSKLYNLLAEEASLQQNFARAKTYYNKVVTMDFEADYYTEGLLSEQEKIKALVGLRNIAMQEKQYLVAIDWHQKYQAMLKNGWLPLLEQNRLRDDKILATCYQYSQQSERAINLLAPYAFGLASAQSSQIDKAAIHHLVDLLQSKYSKKDFRKMKKNIAKQIMFLEKEGRIYFYLSILQNKIYFANDTANYPRKLTQNKNLKGQAIAHYQRKFRNSYFYACLMKR